VGLQLLNGLSAAKCKRNDCKVRLSKAELTGCRKVQIMLPLVLVRADFSHVMADPRAIVTYIEVYINARHKRKRALRLKLYCGRGFANQGLTNGVITGSVPL